MLIDSFTINLNAQVHETTAFNASAPTWKTFRPGVVNWSGSMMARLDDGNAAPLPLAVGGSAVSCVFTYGTTATLTGDIVISSVAPAIRVGSLSLIPITFNGTGQLLPGGANSILGSTAFATGASGIPEWNDNGSSAKPIVIQTTSTPSSKTLTGADGFWSSISLTASVSEVVRVSVGVQGSGSLTAT